MLESAFDSPVNPAEWQVLLTHRSCGELVVMGAGRERPIFISTPFRYDETRGIRAPSTSFESSPASDIRTTPGDDDGVCDAVSFLPRTRNCEPVGSALERAHEVLRC